MYNVFLIISMLVVVLSPFLLDLLMSVQELRYDRPEPMADKKKSPSYAWAAPHIR